MRLYPSDLGNEWHVLLVRRRTQQGARLPLRSLTTMSGDAAEGKRIGRLGQLWTWGLPVSREAAAKTLPDAARETRRPLIAGIVLAAALAVPALAGFASPDNSAEGILLAAVFSLGAFWTLAIVVPRRRFRRLHRRPLTDVEVDDLLRQATRPIRPAGTGSVFVALAGELRRTLTTRDELPLEAARTPPPLGDLEIAFLTLIRDVVVLPGLENALAEHDLRDALLALGEAISRLPHVPASPAETIVLRQNASAARARARNEDDPVVAASLARQADALEREAEAADETNVLARRTAFLRQELLAQTRALRAGLSAFHNTSSTPAWDASALTGLAQAVEAVAGETKALALARRELDEANEPGWTASAAAPPVEARLRQRR